MAKGDLVATLSLNDRFTSRMAGLSKSVRNVASGIGGAFKAVARRLFSIQGAIGALVGGLAMRDLLKAFTIQEKAVVEFTAALERGGKGGEGFSEDMQKLASSLQAVGTQGDEAILMASKLAAQTQAIGAEDMPAAIKGAVDLAAALGMDLNTSMRLIVNAANGMTSTFTRYGIKIDETVSKSGDFRAILDEIGKSTKGADVALRSTTAGSLTALNNTFGDLKETLGEFLAATINSGLSKWLEVVIQQMDVFAKSFDKNTSAAAVFADAAILSLKAIGFAVAATLDFVTDLRRAFVVARIEAAKMGLAFLKDAESGGLLTTALGLTNSALREQFASLRAAKDAGFAFSGVMEAGIGIMEGQAVSLLLQERAVDRLAKAFKAADTAAAEFSEGGGIKLDPTEFEVGAGVVLHSLEQMGLLASDATVKFVALESQAANFSPDFQVTSDEMAAMIDSMIKQAAIGQMAMAQLQQAAEEMGSAFEQVATQALDRTLDAAFAGQIRNAEDLGKIVQKMLEDIAKELIKIAIIRGISTAAGAFSIGTGTTSVAGVAQGGIIPGGMSSISGGLSMTRSTGGGMVGGMAMGGMAGGGIISQPTVLIGGERSRPELMIPLQNGGVPVIETGGGSGRKGETFVFNINSADSQDVQRLFRRPEAREAIRANVVEDVRTNGRFRSEISGVSR